MLHSLVTCLQFTPAPVTKIEEQRFLVVDNTVTHINSPSNLAKMAHQLNVAKGSGKVRNADKEVSKSKVLRLHTVFGVLTQSEDLVSSLHSIYSSTSG